MKKIILLPILTLVLMTQMPFNAKADLSPADQASVAFYEKQAQEREAFIQQHPDLVAKLDAEGKAVLARKDAERIAKEHGGELPAGAVVIPPTTPLTSDDKSTLADFLAKQKADKEAFQPGKTGN